MVTHCSGHMYTTQLQHMCMALKRQLSIRCQPVEPWQC
jgi:hypothetical protein